MVDASDGGHSLEIDVYGGYAGEIGDTGIGYDVGSFNISIQVNEITVICCS